ncbi:MAG: serine protease [Staphylococcus rostri]|uniref:trypsin-like serine peptidase n=1 Tax=Staphylococcus rostri TaxID=522262 RepID=UPI0026E0C268|nr:serine protease [Staphylococcus rostri]MDO5375666.1 serine protease [Staphylococcus rostri]
MKCFKLIFFSLFSMSLFIPSLTQLAFADAYVTNNAYEKQYGSEQAFKLAQSIDDSLITIGPVNEPIPEMYQSVGRLVNSSANTAATAVVVGDYTLLTNNHLVEDTKTKPGARNYRPAPPDKLRFYPMQSPSKKTYTFTIKDVHMIKGVDLAVVHTNKKLSDYIRPMPIASEQNIESMAFKDAITIVGYPTPKYFESRFPELANIPNHQMFITNGFYLNKATTPEPQFYFNAVTRKGNSGSPIMNKNNELIGIFPNGFNNTGQSTFKYNVEEMGYGIAITQSVRTEIYGNMQ